MQPGIFGNSSSSETLRSSLCSVPLFHISPESTGFNLAAECMAPHSTATGSGLPLLSRRRRTLDTVTECVPRNSGREDIAASRHRLISNNVTTPLLCDFKTFTNLVLTPGDEDAAQYYTGIGDFASNANANTEPKPHHDHTNLSGSARQSTPVDQGFAALALGQAWTIPDVVTAALDRVRECGTVEVSHVAKAQITSVVKLLEATQAVALDSDELSGLRFTRD